MARGIVFLPVVCLLTCIGFPADASAQSAGLDEKLNFANDIVPVLTRVGCNAGGCHGKQAGRNGFKLSLFGFDPAFDYQALTSESRGRRVFPAAPRQSLMLAMATGRVVHGGGQRFEEDSREYQLLLKWIQQGMPFGEDEDPTFFLETNLDAERFAPVLCAGVLEYR